MNDWISVKNKLPEKEQKVLFYVKERDEIFAGCFSLRFENNQFEFVENLDGWNFFEETITHWMPLPEPPKEEVWDG